MKKGYTGTSQSFSYLKHSNFRFYKVDLRKIRFLGMLKKLSLLVLSCILLCGAHAQMPYMVKQADGSSKEVLILPCYYPHDSTWKKIAYVQNRKEVSPRFGDFNNQLEQLMQAVVSRGEHFSPGGF